MTYAINSHEARCNDNLTAIIDEAWNVCDIIDPRWECDEASVGEIAEALEENGYGELAQRLVAKVEAEYKRNRPRRRGHRRGYHRNYRAA